MQAEQKSRDLQITSLVMEMQKGFSTHSNLSSEQNSARDEEMNKLYESLENSFSNLNVKSGEQEDRSPDESEDTEASLDTVRLKRTSCTLSGHPIVSLRSLVLLSVTFKR